MTAGSAPRPDATLGGRPGQKARTRQSLVDAALTLFATQGYEATSTDEIADWAGVSPRTFFRYFDSKDRVLFFGGDAFNRSVVQALPDRPPGLSDLDALAATMVELTPDVTPLKHRIRLYFKAVDGSSALLGQHARATAEHEAAVAAALAQRRGRTRPDAGARLAAGIGTVAMDHAYMEWLSSRRDLAELVEQTFGLVHTIAGRPTARRRS